MYVIFDNEQYYIFYLAFLYLFQKTIYVGHGIEMKLFKKLKEIKYFYGVGRTFMSDSENKKALHSLEKEHLKIPLRSDVINYLLEIIGGRDRSYLEIGVRDVSDNFEKIIAEKKYGVDPGYERLENSVDFKMTSDEFFKQLSLGKILSPLTRFDVIFIDGLHLADQAYADIQNSLKFIRDDGFIVLHDCNPPTEYHARENPSYQMSPARGQWNGTVWKAAYKIRIDDSLSFCVIDSDFGIGIITKNKYFEHLDIDINPFFEYRIFDTYREKSLNLMSFDRFKKVIKYQYT